MPMSISSLSQRLSMVCYPDDNNLRNQLELTLIDLIDVLGFNATLFMNWYFISTSFSILSLCMTCCSGYALYNQITKLYIKSRMAHGGTQELATSELKILSSYIVKRTYQCIRAFTVHDI